MSIIKRARIGWRDATNGYVVTSSNNRICWKEVGGGALITATVTPGTYSDLELAAALKEAMDTAGAGTYAVWRDGDDEKFQLQQLENPAGAVFNIWFACASTIALEIGFDESYHGGALTYGADFATPDITYLDLTEPVRSPEFLPDFKARSDLRSLSGRRRSTRHGAAVRKWEADLWFNNFNEADEFFDFLTWAWRGAAFRWWPDKTNLHRWVEVQIGNTQTPVTERLPLFKNFAYRIMLEQVGNNQGTIDLEDLQDR